jgi:hypothetical protein
MQNTRTYTIAAAEMERASEAARSSQPIASESSNCKLANRPWLSLVESSQLIIFERRKLPVVFIISINIDAITMIQCKNPTR